MDPIRDLARTGLSELVHSGIGRSDGRAGHFLRGRGGEQRMGATPGVNLGMVREPEMSSFPGTVEEGDRIAIGVASNQIPTDVSREAWCPSGGSRRREGGRDFRPSTHLRVLGFDRDELSGGRLASICGGAP
jgi:hypothetical protein